MPDTPALTESPRTLVVGAAGQVGTQLVRLLGPRALAAGRTPHPPAHLAEIPWLQVDLTALAESPASAPDLLAAAGPLAAVICVAGATDVERCQTDAAWAYAVNTHGPAALAATTHANTPVAYFSTEYVFDGDPANPGPYTEQSPTHAISIYGDSKLQGERLVSNARPDALILRTTVVFGPDPAQKNFLYFLHRQLSTGKPIRVVTDQISTPTSNDDLAAATLALLEKGETGIFHVCGPDLLSRFDFAVRSARVLGLNESLIEPISTASLSQKAPRPLAAGLSTEKLRSALGPDYMHSTEAAVAAWQRATLPKA